MPLFSVIIPLYNKENFIEATLKSALSQTFADFEIIIINDGSTDKSEEKVLQFTDDRIRLFTTENQGVSQARNFGIEKASGEMIAFLDADDFWYPTFLENMVSLIAKFPEEKVFSSAIEVETKNKIFKATYSIPNHQEIIKINFFEGSHDQGAIFTSSAVFEKSVFESVGNFEPSLKTDEDTDLWIRIGLKYPVIFSWKIGAKYNFDKYGLSRSNINYSKKSDFSQYLELEKTNEELATFLAIHRFSMAIKSKISGTNRNFLRFYGLINLKKLDSKQRFLLRLPSTILRTAFKLKLMLEHFSIRLSAFK